MSPKLLQFGSLLGDNFPSFLSVEMQSETEPFFETILGPFWARILDLVLSKSEPKPMGFIDET